MKKKIILAWLIAACFSFPYLSRAEEAGGKILKSIEILAGYDWAEILSRNWYKIHENGRPYRDFPLMVDFDFDLKGLTRKINFDPASLLEIQVEPFVAYVQKPGPNAEAGINFFIKAGILPETSKFQPYIKGGLGLLYMTQHTREQSTQFNFNEIAGCGMHYYFQENLALTLEGRFRHISNSGMRKPNHGINTYAVLVGVARKF
ncbi:MAG: acyloxyacyl hydrolase [Candidatus Omnitrophota bacterium]